MADQDDERRQAQSQTASRGLREEQRDHDLVYLDEREVRERMRDAQERFVRLGLAVYLVAVLTKRNGVRYSLELHPDGAREIPLRDIQEVADEFALDLHTSGDFIMGDPRPRPNWSTEE